MHPEAFLKANRFCGCWTAVTQMVRRMWTITSLLLPACLHSAGWLGTCSLPATGSIPVLLMRASIARGFGDWTRTHRRLRRLLIATSLASALAVYPWICRFLANGETARY